MRFDTSRARGVVSRPGRGSLGSPRGSPPPVSMQRADPICPTVRQTCDRLASSLQVRVASPELLRAHLRPDPFGWAACQGLCPHRDITKARPRARDIPSLARSVHRLSQPLDGFLRTSAPGLISSPSRVQGVVPVQGLLSPCSAPASSAGAAPLPLARPVLEGPLGPTSAPGVVPRLRGFHPHGGACSFHR